MHYLLFIAVAFACSCVCNAQEKLPGFDSPDLAFHAYVTGAATEDFDLLLSALTRESKAYHIGLSIFSATFLFGEDPEMQKLFRDHGLQPTSDADEQEESGNITLVDAMSTIKEPGKLMKGIVDRQNELAKLLVESEGSVIDAKPPSRKELLRLISSVTLQNKKISGNIVTASTKLEPDAKEAFTSMPSKIQFRRIKDRWYCD